VKIWSINLDTQFNVIAGDKLEAYDAAIRHLRAMSDAALGEGLTVEVAINEEEREDE
jgi:hypothetical protein